MKKCNKCQTEKELNEFHKDSTEKNGYKYTCKECTLGHKPRVIPTINKVCTCCKIDKPIEQYSIIQKIYRKSQCKTCVNKKKQIKRDLNPKQEYIRKRKVDLKQKYNITIEEYNKMYIEAEGKCQICDNKFDTLCVDSISFMADVYLQAALNGKSASGKKLKVQDADTY